MSTDKKIAVVGATGRVGHQVVEVLTERGHEVVPIARTQGVDVITGEGLAEALAGASASSIPPPARRPSRSRRPSSSRPPRGICRRLVGEPACGGSSPCRSSTPTG
jgi:NAD(P)-dependent dehydrogenase (short-subunit alcohol dehydrogenase family)